MKIIGDIGNSDVKICLTDKNYKILKKIIIKTTDITRTKIKNKLFFLVKKKNKECIFKKVTISPSLF